jgi:hypothetical protein
MPSGGDLLRKGLSHLGEQYSLGVVAPKNNGAWKGPWDCAEFLSWCVFQVTGRLYGCADNHVNPARADAYTGYWQRDAAAIGRPVSVAIAAQTPGAAVVRYAQPNPIGHIVFSDGAGGTLEAHSASTGVVQRKLANRRWDAGILVPGVEYSHAADTMVVSAPLLVLRLSDPLMRGAIVREVQRALKVAGIHPGKIDGLYGAQTVAAVNAFQITRGLVPDGEVGPETARLLGVDFPS